MIRPLTLVTMVAAMGAGLHVYQTKHEVALLDDELRGIVREIETANERILALQAEWAWLNEPERLRETAQRYLQLEAMQPTQFVRLSELERHLPPVTAYDGPPALFAARKTPPESPEGMLALLPRAEDVPPPAVQVATAAQPASDVTTAPDPSPASAAAPEPVPVLAVVSPRTAPAATQDAPTTDADTAITAAPLPMPPPAPPPAPMPALAAVAAPPRPAEPRPTVAETRPAPRRAVARPVHRPAPEVAALTPVAAPMHTATARSPAPTPVRPPQAEVPAGSLLGATRPMLAPPVPFGAANAATLGGGAR